MAAEKGRKQKERRKIFCDNKSSVFFFFSIFFDRNMVQPLKGFEVLKWVHAHALLE